MTSCGRRLILHHDFETTVGEVSRALRDEGFEIIGRTDVRDQCRQILGQVFRHYMLLEAWCTGLAFEALQQNPDLGPLLAVTFAVYEARPDETVVLFPGFRRARLGDLARAQDEEIARIGRVFHRLERAVQHHPAWSAA
jgi:uncharacterized protein (DUF302 family)